MNKKSFGESEKIFKKEPVKKAIPLPKPKVTKKTVCIEKQDKEEAELVDKVIKETRSRTKKLILEEEEEVVQVDCHLAKRVKTQDWDDLDAEDGYDPCMVAEYVVEIFEYMKELEVFYTIFILMYPYK